MLSQLLDALSKDRVQKMHIPKFIQGCNPGDICKSEVQFRFLGTDDTGTNIEIIDVALPECEEEDEKEDMPQMPMIVPNVS